MSTIVNPAVLSLSLACLLAAAPALAEPDIPSVSVRTVDLNLATPAGVQALRGRIARAVRSVCGDADLRDLQAMMEQNACRTMALAKAVPQMEVAIAHGDTHNTYSATNAKETPPAS